MILLDTNIVIGYLAGDQELIKAVDQAVIAHGDIALSTISVVELFSYPALEETERRKITEFTDRALLLNLTGELAVQAADIRRTTKLTMSDAVIGATALRHDIFFISRDQNFKKVSGLKLLVP